MRNPKNCSGVGSVAWGAVSAAAPASGGATGGTARHSTATQSVNKAVRRAII
jgi:hypothetical protein